jgi:hypothetical protein
LQEWFGAFVNIMEAHREGLFAGPLHAHVNGGLEEQVWCFGYSDLVVLATNARTGGISCTAAALRSMASCSQVLENSLMEQDSLAMYRLINDGKVFTLQCTSIASRDAWVATVQALKTSASTAASTALAACSPSNGSNESSGGVGSK